MVKRGTAGAARSVQFEPSAIADTIARTDYFRRSPAAIGGLGYHKEWQHFVITAPAFDLLVNFSVCDEVRPGAPTGSELARIVLLVREHTWDGDVETFASDTVRVDAGRIVAAFGHNLLEFADGRFQISVCLEDRPITLALDLTPLTLPAVVPTVAMLDGPPLHWVVVPRLAANGRLTVGNRAYRLDDAPAYHDHNWGHFYWGNDVSWEWGFVLPEDDAVPWCLTFVRLTNRSRTSTLMQNILLWRWEQLVAIFRDRDLQVYADPAYLQLTRVFKVPRVMALVAPEVPTDVPRSLHVRADSDGNWVECASTSVDVAQVLIPGERKLGVTIFNEVAARWTVRGCFAGEAMAFEGRSIMEFIRA